MQYKKAPNGFLLRLEKGEEIGSKIIEFAKTQNIGSSFIHALGAVSALELGYYHLDKKDYSWKVFNEDLEIASLTGNISMVDNEPFVHMHGVFANESLITFGGHIKRAEVGATCEVYLVNFDMDISRKFDEEIGLKLLDLEEK